jgi:tetratricopeptide (TPR) repeat protein
MRPTYLFWTLFLFLLSFGTSVQAQPGGGSTSKDLTTGAELIFRRPEDPKSEPGGGRLGSGERDRDEKPSNKPTPSATPRTAKVSSHVQNQTIARGNAARSAPVPRYSEAEREYLQATSQDPDDPRGFAGLGNVYLDQGRYKEAVDAYRHTIKLNSDYQLAYMPLGYALVRLNRIPDAIDVYNELLKIDPDDPEVFNNLGYAYNHTDRFQDSIDACKKAIELLGETGKAYKQGLQVREEVLSQAYKNLGNAYNGLKRYNEAADALKQSTKIEPKSASAHFNLGLALYNGGRYSESIESFKETLKLKPGLAQAHFMLGMNYIAINDKAQALEQYNVLKNINKQLAEQLRSSIP